MKKDLPNIFANKIEKTINNNKKYSVSKNEEEIITTKQKPIMEKNINQKINEIFNSPRYVYKAKVYIKTNDVEMTKQIVGRNGNSLITIENELINISDIKDIKFSE